MNNRSGATSRDILFFLMPQNYVWKMVLPSGNVLLGFGNPPQPKVSSRLVAEAVYVETQTIKSDDMNSLGVISHCTAHR